MSGHSTLTLTRSEAIREVTLYMENASNKEIERLVDIVLDERLYNAIVVPDGSLLSDRYRLGGTT